LHDIIIRLDILDLHLYYLLI